jgi:hypothetical protein
MVARSRPRGGGQGTERVRCGRRIGSSRWRWGV